MNIKNEIFQALVAYLKTQLQGGTPPLTTKLIAEGEEVLKFPSLGILPGMFTFDPCNELERDDSTDGRLLVEVGSFIGTAELRIYANNAPEREQWGQRIEDAFMRRVGAPGIVVVQTPPVKVRRTDNTLITTLHQALAAFELNESRWEDEMVFAKKQYQYNTIDVAYPVLVLREGADAYTMEDLQLAFADEVNAAAPDSSLVVNVDGTVTPTP